MAASDHLGAQFGIGDTVHIPPTRKFPGGPVTVDWMNKSHFTGTLPDGTKVGKTGIGLVEGFRGSKLAPQPWRVDKRAS